MRKPVIILCAAIVAAALLGCASPKSSASVVVPQTHKGEGDPQSSNKETTPKVPGVLAEDEWGNLFATMGDEYVAFGRRVQDEAPVKAYVCYQGEGGGDPLWFDEPDTIVSMFNALAAANVSADPGMVSTDDYTSFGFEFADGASTHFMFESMAFMVAEGNTYKYYGVVTNPELDAFASMARKATLGA